MSKPPRRSRPQKPGETIDLAAQRIENEPIEPQTADAPGRSEAAAADPETRLADAASTVPEPGGDRPFPSSGTGIPSVEASGIAALGEPEPGDRNAPPAADGTSREPAPGESEHDPGTSAAGGRTAPEGDAPPVEASLPETVAADESSAAGERLGHERKTDRETPPDELDAETILAGAGPHAVEPPPPPRPELDYHETPPHAAPPHGPGLGTAVGAGLLGAVLALLLGGGLQYAGVLPAARAPDTAELTREFARAGDVQQLTTDVTAVRNDVGQLQSTLSAGGAGGQAGPSGADFAALADRFNNLEGRLNALSSGTEQGGAAAPAIDPNALKNAADTANGARDTANGARDAAAAAKQAADGAGAQAAEARQTAQTASQAAGTASQAADVAQQAANGAMEAAKVNGQAIEDIRSRIGAVEEGGRRAAVAVSAANLKAAVDRGGPFMAELETFARAAGASPAVDALRDYAPDGVPTLAALQDEWPDTRKAVLAALRPNDPNADVGSQILSGFSSLVAVRPSASTESVGNGQGGPNGTVAELDRKLQAGDLDGWLSSWQGLPEAARVAGAGFRDRLEARARAETVVGSALSGAVNSIGSPN